MSKTISVEGLQKDQKKLTESFHKELAVFTKAQKVYEKAKLELVTFNNKYGRVLEVLDAAE